MKRNVFTIVTMIALALSTSLLPSLASAAGSVAASHSVPAGTDAPAGATVAAPTTWAPGNDTWMGAAAAILCGLYIRVTVSSGGSVGAIVGAVAACTFMVFDALTDRG